MAGSGQPSAQKKKKEKHAVIMELEEKPKYGNYFNPARARWSSRCPGELRSLTVHLEPPLAGLVLAQYISVYLFKMFSIYIHAFIVFCSFYRRLAGTGELMST